MDIRKLQRAIVDGLEDVKAQDIAVFNTEHLSPLFERVIIASGTSNRQTKALASSVRQAVKAAGFQVMRTEGEDNGEWIIVDCAAAVVHIMQPAIRQYYQLEEIWGEKPVAIQVKAGRKSLVKASEPMDEEEPVKPKKASGKTTAAKKAATTAPTRKVAGKVAAKKAPAKKLAAVKEAAPAKAPAAKKVAAKKAAVKTVAVKKVAAKKVAAKKATVKAPVQKVLVNAPAKKKAPAAKKVAAKKVVTRKVAAKKVAAKKAPAKKTAR
ncbi:ribosome silencing factor [Aquabacterium sp.]|uniref:ribosome silencing factor n=1 Tax=Aquabacterium sp. TaxID=1872578 RepID=UPI002E35504A|nr:ribosome silencing factor [Aquabacterium sp.]HEX5310526.1 ribosome silencing factor [Aquabacterium sp.]